MNKKVLIMALAAVGLGTVGFLVVKHYGSGCETCSTVTTTTKEPSKVSEHSTMSSNGVKTAAPEENKKTKEEENTKSKCKTAECKKSQGKKTITVSPKKAKR